ncbi:phage tail protein [Vibrio cholerae]|nr:hypothetical protein [Vibrio cholerae]EGR0939061.1 hypothetical protein [Vibrio cholerae]EJL6636792.1 phage tail protein [Vibrio cholerae]
MDAVNDFLFFYIDEEEIQAIQKILGANEKQVLQSHARALARTAVTIKSITHKLIKSEMKVKKLDVLRRRFQSFKLKQAGKTRLDELKLWFGLNDLKVSDIRGRIARIGSKKNPKGARFTPLGNIAKKEYDKAFVANVRGKRSIYQRASRKRHSIFEQKIPISNDLQIMIEDEVFKMLPEIYMHHFEVDLKGRTKMNIGR